MRVTVTYDKVSPKAGSGRPYSRHKKILALICVVLFQSSWAIASESNQEDTSTSQDNTATETELAKEEDTSTAVANEFEIITVTTERRRQTIQDVPASVQAFSAYEMQALGVGTDFRNLQAVVPGLHITDQEGQIEVFLRGIGTTNNDFSSDPAVATHYNGMYVGRPRGIGLMFFDLERVEVNKGPQGTLRGRNATAGTINIISRTPNLNALEGSFRAGVGNFNSRQVESALNVPLIKDQLAVRGAVFHQSHTAYVSNALNNGVEGPGAEDDLALRLSAKWEPTSMINFNVVFDYADETGTGNPGQFWGASLSAGFDTNDLDDPRSQFFLQEGRVENEIMGINFSGTVDFDVARIEVQSGYREYDFSNRNHRRPFQRGVNFPGVDVSGEDLDNFGTLYQVETSQSFVNEIRLVSSDSARVKWTIGGFHYLENFGRMSWDILDKSLAQNNLGGQSVTLPESSVESFAAYADADWEIIDRFRLKGGVRLTHEEKKEQLFQAQYTFAFDGINPDNAGTVRSGTPGFQLKNPNDLTITNPLTADPKAAFLDAVESFGARDNLDELLDDTSSSVSVTTTDPAGLEFKSYEATYANWRIGAEFDLTPRNLLYGTASTGTRSGGINPTVQVGGSRIANNFDPEDLYAFELGSKNEFSFGKYRATINGTGFVYLYTNQVLQSLVASDEASSDANNQQNFLTNANAGNSWMVGIELDGRASLPLGLSLGWSLAFLNSEYSDTEVNESRLPGRTDTNDIDGDGNTEESIPNPQVNLEGGPLQNVSTWNAAINLRQVIPFDWGWLDWTINYTFRSEFFYTPFGGRGFDYDAQEIPLADMVRPGGFEDQNGNFLSDRVPDVHLVNINSGINLIGGDIRIEGYVTNLTNYAYATKGFVNPFVNIRFLNPPRTFGANLIASF